MQILAAQGDAVLTGWYVGYAIGLVVILLVVALVGTILALARRIGLQAAAITSALDAARVNTLPLWDVARVNDGLRAIVKDAQIARATLEGGK